MSTTKSVFLILLSILFSLLVIEVVLFGDSYSMDQEKSISVEKCDSFHSHFKYFCSAFKESLSKENRFK